MSETKVRDLPAFDLLHNILLTANYHELQEKNKRMINNSYHSHSQ